MTGKVVLLGGAALVLGAILLAASAALGPTWRMAGVALVILSVVLIASAMVGGKRKGAHR